MCLSGIVSWNVPCVGYVNPPVVVSSADLSMDEVASLSSWLWKSTLITLWVVVQRLIQEIRIYSSRFWCLLRSTFVCAAYRSSWVSSDVVWIHPSVVLVLGPFGRNSSAFNVKNCLCLALDNLFGVSKWSAVCGCLCWAWACMAVATLYTQASFHQHWAWGKINKRPKAPTICLYC